MLLNAHALTDDQSGHAGGGVPGRFRGAWHARVGEAITVLAQTCLNGGGHALLEEELHCLGRFIR